MTCGTADRYGALAQLGAHNTGSVGVVSSSLIRSTNIGKESADIIIEKEGLDMIEKNLKKLRAKKWRVTNGFNTGTRDMKLKTAYRRKKNWSADADQYSYLKLTSFIKK